MLVLTRKQNEQIRIGEDIVITIVRTKGKAVRVGIQAPEHLSILRGELVFDMGDDSEKVCPYCSTLFRYNAALKADETKPEGCTFTPKAA